MIFNSLHDFYYQYQQPLASCLHEIEKTGILVHEDRMQAFKGKLATSLANECQAIEQLVHKKVIAKNPSKTKQSPTTLNLSSPAQLMAELESQGVKIPHKMGKKTTDETALQRLYAKTGLPFLQHILNVRELNKLDGYAKTLLYNSVYHSIFPPCGTVAGRRSSRASWQSDQRAKISVGGNLQNFPRHSLLGLDYRECFISRPGYIFIACDQKSADDWTINGIIADMTGVTTGIDELMGSVSRHSILAGKLFNKQTSAIDKKGMEYYLAKKTRYAGSYGMWGKTMSEQLAKEARFFPESACNDLLKTFHREEPNVINVFQRYVETQLNTKRLLRTPIGRQRYFYGLRSFSDNSTIYREGYSYIPLSTTGDNNGLAILYMYPHTSEEFYIVQEIHDSITMECKNDIHSINRCCSLLEQAFNRKLTFDNGFTMQIPIEFEMGYDMKNMKTFDYPCQDSSSVHGLQSIYMTLPKPAMPQCNFTNGQASQSYQQHLKGMSTM